MARFHEMRVWLAVGCLFLAGCPEDAGATPCSSNLDCPSTRSCVAGRCRFTTDDAQQLDDAGATDASADRDAITLDASADGGGTDGARWDDAGRPGVDGGCAGGPCCNTDAVACGLGSVCRPSARGATLGACVPCDATARVVCASFASGSEVETLGSECEAFAAGAQRVDRNACRCGDSARCTGGQICNLGVRHLRDCSDGTAPQGLCVVPSVPSCDVLPHRELACDGTTVFTDECERLSTTGMGVMSRYALDCATTGLAGACFDDTECGAGSSCYAAAEGCVAGTCQSDPSAGACYDFTDCLPWQDCTTTCTGSSDCARGTCIDVR